MSDFKQTFTPAVWRDKRGVFDGSEFDLLVTRARECLLWQMSPDYWDNMSVFEHAAWHQAWIDLNDERSA